MFGLVLSCASHGLRLQSARDDGSPTTVPLDIHRLVTHREERAWDWFVRSSPDGTLFHLTAWKRVVEDVFRHTPHYLLAVDGGEVRGVLPLFEIRGLLVGHVLVSVPYGVYGGLCAADPSACEALIDAARKLAEGLWVRHIEFRHRRDSVPGLPTKSHFATFVKPIDADPDENFAAIPRKQRRMIRLGIKHGLEARQGWEFLAEFYEVYAVSRRRLGAPLFPLRLFETIRNHFRKEARLLTVWHKGCLVAGVISFFYEDRVMPYYGAALPDAFSLAVTDFMYWELMRESSLAGYRVFDFGQSHQDSGTYGFKRHWGFDPEPMAYQYMPINGSGVPNRTPSSLGPRLFSQAWKHLPLPVTKWIGPPLTRWLPLH